MDDKHAEIIIVRRRAETEEEHHGGAWKIAYADFVTAMMAFFLVLWIINSTSKETQTIIARYFNPVKMEDFSKAKRGIRESNEKSGETADPKEKEVKDNGGVATLTSSEGATKAPESKAKAPEVRSADEGVKGKETRAVSEERLMHEPMAALEQIAGKVEPRNPASGKDGLTNEFFRDPFMPQAPATANPPEEQNPNAPSEPHADAALANESANVANAADMPRVAEDLQRDIAKAISVEAGKNAPHLEVAATDEGLLISLTDELNFGMFALGSAEPNAKLVRIMDKIAQSLKDRPGQIVLRGHTDGRAYKSGNFENWRLSSQRAQMALYMLLRGGLSEQRIDHVEGYADKKLKVKDDPDAAANRRIEILLRKPASR